MREYFEAEMRQLHEVAQEFARVYPEQAAMLNIENLKDRDPYVERLLEGVAFLSAQIRQRIDDDLPEVSEGLLSLLWPHFLRPLPSLTIMEFTPRENQLQQPYVLPRHLAMKAPQVKVETPLGDELAQCTFRTTYPVTLYPLSLTQVTAQDHASGGTVIGLRFRVEGNAKLETLDLKRLKLYLHADPAVAALLYKALAGGTRGVQVRFPEQPLKEPFRLGGSEALQPCHLEPEDALIPLNGRSFYGFHLLQEYFAFREKYYFVSVEGLDRVAWPARTREFIVEIHTSEVFPGDISLTPEMFRLHCVPAINLFTATSDPVPLTQRRYEYPVIADATNRYSTEVYSVDEVVGFDPKGNDRWRYAPLYSFQHDRTGRYFSTSRRVLGSGRAETYITVSDGGAFREQTLSCEITACNGHVPRAHLQVGSINVKTKACPAFVSFRNLTRPTRMLLPPERAAYQWVLISHLAMNYSSISQTDTLRRLLGMYEWTREEQNQRRVRGVEVIGWKGADMVHHGALMRGIEVQLRFDDRHYSAVADSYLFGMLLHRFFSTYASINSFVATRALTEPSNQEFAWKPLIGQASPI